MCKWENASFPSTDVEFIPSYIILVGANFYPSAIIKLLINVLTSQPAE